MLNCSVYEFSRKLFAYSLQNIFICLYILMVKNKINFFLNMVI